MKKKLIISTAIAWLPMIAFAEVKTLHDLTASLAKYLNDALALLMGFAVVAFIYYVVRFFIVDADGKNRAVAGQYVMWSLIGFFVIFSVWGIVNFLIATFDLGTGQPGTWTSMINLFPQ